jgi:hypothetical protein
MDKKMLLPVLGKNVDPTLVEAFKTIMKSQSYFVDIDGKV